jgi:hypothetical protein
MEYNIDEKYFRIEIKGSKKEIRKFARCLVEVINKFYLSDLESTKLTKDTLTLNPTRYERIYLSNASITYLPNVGDEFKSFHFNIIKDNYEKAKEKFEKH